MLYTYFFFAKKKGYDSDEVWSYALSNSYYRPFLETTAGWNMAYTKEDTHYISEWFNGSVYHDYIHYRAKGSAIFLRFCLVQPGQ